MEIQIPTGKGSQSDLRPNRIIKHDDEHCDLLKGNATISTLQPLIIGDVLVNKFLDLDNFRIERRKGVAKCH